MPRQHGRDTAGGNCNHQRRTVDDRWDDEARQLDIIDHVHQHIALASRRGDACIYGAIVRGGHREQGAVKVGGLETRCDMYQGAHAGDGHLARIRRGCRIA